MSGAQTGWCTSFWTLTLQMDEHFSVKRHAIYFWKRTNVLWLTNEIFFFVSFSHTHCRAFFCSLLLSLACSSITHHFFVCTLFSLSGRCLFFSFLEDRYVTRGKKTNTKSTSSKTILIGQTFHIYPKFIHIHMLIAKFTAFSIHSKLPNTVSSLSFWNENFEKKKPTIFTWYLQTNQKKKR